MSARPEGPASSGGAFPTGGDLNGGGKLGAHAEPLDVLEPPGARDAGAAFTVCLGPLALSEICKFLTSFAFNCAMIDASSVACNARSSRAACSKVSLILLEESEGGPGIATAQRGEARDGSKIKKVKRLSLTLNYRRY